MRLKLVVAAALLALTSVSLASGKRFLIPVHFPNDFDCRVVETDNQWKFVFSGVADTRRAYSWNQTSTTQSTSEFAWFVVVDVGGRLLSIGSNYFKGLGQQRQGTLQELLSVSQLDIFDYGTGWLTSELVPGIPVSYSVNGSDLSLIVNVGEPSGPQLFVPKPKVAHFWITEHGARARRCRTVL